MLFFFFFFLRWRCCRSNLFFLLHKPPQRFLPLDSENSAALVVLGNPSSNAGVYSQNKQNNGLLSYCKVVTFWCGVALCCDGLSLCSDGMLQSCIDPPASLTLLACQSFFRTNGLSCMRLEFQRPHLWPLARPCCSIGPTNSTLLQSRRCVSSNTVWVGMHDFRKKCNMWSMLLCVMMLIWFATNKQML